MADAFDADFLSVELDRAVLGTSARRGVSRQSSKSSDIIAGDRGEYGSSPIDPNTVGNVSSTSILSQGLATLSSTSGMLPRSVMSTRQNVLFVQTGGQSEDVSFGGWTGERGTGLQSTTEDSRALFSARSDMSSSIGGQYSMVDRVDSATSAVRFDIFICPDSISDMKKICGWKIGSGTTVCIKTNCSKKHRGGSKASIEVGNILVLKATDVAFCEPKTNASNVATELLDIWNENKYTMEEWIELFMLANATNHTEILTKDSVGPAKTFVDFAKSWKSPGRFDRLPFGADDTFGKLSDNLFRRAKRKADSDMSEENMLEASRRHRRAAEVAEIGIEESIENLKSNDEELFARSSTTDEVVEALVDQLDVTNNKTSEEMLVLVARTKTIESALGNRSGTTYHETLAAPPVWANVAILGGVIIELQEALKLMPNEDSIKSALKLELQAMQIRSTEALKEAVDTAELSSKYAMEVLKTETGTEFGTANRKASKVLEEMYEVDKRMQELANKQKNLESVTTKLVQGTVQMRHEINTVRMEGTVQSGNKTSTPTCIDLTSPSCEGYLLMSTFEAALAQARNEHANVSSRLEKLIMESDGETVKFMGLGFRNRKDSDVWIQKNMPDVLFGTIVDVHLVLEHVYKSMSESAEVIVDMQAVQKLKFENSLQAVALTAYNGRLPKVLSKASHAVMSRSSTKSHFDRVPTNAVWDELDTGIRDRIKSELLIFEESHQAMIDDTISEGSKAHILASTALTTSIAWILGFITYLDETYKSLIGQKNFSTEKAWQLVTQLGRRVLLEVGHSRHNVGAQLRPSDNQHNMELMFYSMCRCFDAQRRFKDAAFKDHPAIASEYVKFLAANSGSDLVTKLEKQVEKLETDLKAAVKTASTATTAVATVANKLDIAMKEIAAMQKKVSKLPA